MNVVKCDKNHYYDADKYETCPHCKNGLKKYKKEEFDDVDYGTKETMTENNGEASLVDKNSDDLKTTLLEDDQVTALLEDDPDKTVLLNIN